ncbi:MAG: hypothetical protein COZ31_11120 [Nitrospirae bacterium CG_4_10_14_3_um_filter_44_29]|nr:MAG: hypothetical protein COZ31_11120 [Nitrospirae bacterium CG_4_10_14_3_um_filter_44_29]
MFGNNNNNKSSSEEFLGMIVAVVMFVGTFLILAYKGAAKVTKWGMALHQDRKERERINKL